MTGEKTIPIRDEQFQRSLLVLDDDWLDNHDSLLLHDSLPLKDKENYALAAEWRPEIYYVQRDIFYSLIMAYTNKHSNVRNRISRIAIEGYHLKTGLMMLPACWDKLGQLLRAFLKIECWGTDAATEENTSFQKVLDHLGSNVATHAMLLDVLSRYWDHKNRTDAYKLAKAVKHRWSQHYIGIKSRTSTRIIRNGEGICGFSIGSSPVNPKVLYKHITVLKRANNDFVKCAEKVNQIINFRQFNEDE